ncbi:TPA: hypothetical protein HA246_07105 [Candidatus Woesearchaeota archaeon]|nr:hypothetical protein [Candidatus Woesearchaeota archaeon]
MQILISLAEAINLLICSNHYWGIFGRAYFIYVLGILAFMYLQLNNCHDSLKGEIGEVIAKSVIKNSFRAADANKNLLDQYPINPEQKKLLLDNWFYLDLINIIDDKVTLYEVKTKKYFYKQLTRTQMRYKISKPFLDFCNKAIELGITLKFVQITLFEDWKCGIIIKDFKEKDFFVDKRSLLKKN